MKKQEFKTIREQLRVSRKEYITPHYIRVYLTGDNINAFTNTTIGVNNKILIPPKGLQEIHFPEYDYEAMKWKPQPDDIRPFIRTYTHRGIDTQNKEIWIDFVAHGDEGPASAWAAKAEKGDVLGVLMHDGKTELYAQADWYLLAGDATAIPVLSTILEDLPKTAKGVCIIEVHGREDEHKIDTQADIEFIWIYNKNPQKGSLLPEVVKQQDFQEGQHFGYVAAEFSSVKEIRTYLRKERQWKQQQLYAYSYWKSGVAEDKSATERHQEKDSIQ